MDTADHLARIFEGRVTFVRFVPDDESEMTVQSEMDYMDELGALCDACTTPPEECDQYRKKLREQPADTGEADSGADL